MAHYAKIANDGSVTQVIVAEQDFIDTLPSNEVWIQTSYNTKGGVHYEPNSNTPSQDQSKALRYNFAMPMMGLYDAQADAFYQKQPFPSWTLNTSTYLWEAPSPAPTDGKNYEWNEETQSWTEIG
tara:strand:- start:286 stop:660 length:375 start_codon:yes stop_codon:yes gene_type:complete